MPLRCIYILFLFLFICLYSYAQVNPGSEIAWQRCYGTTGHDFFTDAINTSDGGILAFVVYDNNDGDCADCVDGDGRLLKFDSDLNIIWQKSYYISVEQILEVSDGFVLCGATQLDTGYAAENHGLTDIFMIKTDLNGNFQWSHCYGSTGVDNFTAVTATSDGGYLITGSTYGSNEDIPFHYGSGFFLDAVIFKLDNEGEIEWVKVLGGSDHDGLVNTLPLNEDEYLMIIGANSNDYDLSSSLILGAKFWFFRIDEGGNMYDYNFHIANEDVYAIYNSFFLRGEITFVALSNAESLLFPAIVGHAGYETGIGVLDEDFNILELNHFGGSESDITSFAIVSDNTIYLIGRSKSFDFDLPGNYNAGAADDYWLFAIDTNFQLLWSRNFGGSHSSGEWTYKITNSPGKLVLMDNFIYFFGQCQVPEVLPDYDISCGHINPDLDDDTDAWLVAFDLSTVKEIESPENNADFLIYPNPAENNLFTIEATQPDTQVYEIIIYDTTGRKVFYESTGINNKTILDLNFLGSGIYVISIYGNDQKKSEQKLFIH